MFPGLPQLYEAFADLTLCFSLIPNISVIGVGWTLGVIFLFYILFPVTFLYGNKSGAEESLQMFYFALYFCIWISGAISTESPLLCNPVTKFISKYSMQIYLSHMIVFRLIEKLHPTNLNSGLLVSIAITFVLTVVGSILFSYCL